MRPKRPWKSPLRTLSDVRSKKDAVTTEHRDEIVSERVLLCIPTRLACGLDHRRRVVEEEDAVRARVDLGSDASIKLLVSLRQTDVAREEHAVESGSQSDDVREVACAMRLL